MATTCNDDTPCHLPECAEHGCMSHEGWKEATIAWSVCASLHREYCKGKDPFFKTRQADFIKHENEARAKYLALEPR